MHHLRPDHLHEAPHGGTTALWLARHGGDLAVLLAECQTPAELGVINRAKGSET